MELKVQRDTKITISMTEEEAAGLMALLNVPSRGRLLIADEIYDALSEEEVVMSIETFDDLQSHFASIYE